MKEKMTTREKLSTLWIVVMFTMIFADILFFMTPGVMKQIVDGTTDVKTTQEQLLIFALLLELPIAMIFLSRVLKQTINRIANIVTSIITTLFVIGGGSLYLHYYFFAAVEIFCMIAIIILSFKWKEDEEK